MGHNAKWKICVKFIVLSLTASAVCADTPSVDLSPNSLNLGSQIVGTTSGPSAVTLTNHLTTPLTIFSITATGDFAQSNNCGSALSPGHACTLKVTFTPTAVGTRTGQLIVTDAAATSPQATNLSGTGSVSGLASISMAPTNPSIPVGLKQQFAATGFFKNGTVSDLTTSVTWNSSSPAIATISNSTGSRGLATSSAQGTTVITASVGSVSGSTILTVTPPVLLSITMSPVQPSIVVPNTLQFTATGNFTDGSRDLTAAATWNSSNPAVATISNAGGSQGLATPVAKGTTTISAAVGTFTDSTSLTVKLPLVSIRVLPANGSMPLTTALQFRAIGTFNDGSQQDLTSSATWNSGDPTAAAISNSAGSAGLATPITEGTTTISASTGSLSDSTGLRVTALVPGQARFAYVTNLFDSTVSVYLVDGSSGQLTPNGAPQFVSQMSTPNAVVADPSGKFLYVADQGTFHIFAYTIDTTTGFLTPIDSPVSVSAPFGLAMHPSGKFLFVANGLNTARIYSIDVSGALTFLGQSDGVAGGAISVAVDPSGKFVYTANVNFNTISAYSVDTSTGVQAPIPGSPFPTGPNPEFVAVHPSGNFLYASNGNGQSVSAYSLDSMTGALTQIAGSPFTVGSIPKAIALDPTGKYAFVANSDSNNMSGFTIVSTTGALQPIAGSPFPTGTTPDWAIVDPLSKFLYVVNFSSNNISVFTIDPTSGFLTGVGTVPAGSNPISITLVK